MAKYTLRAKYDPSSRFLYRDYYLIVIDNGDGKLMGWQLSPAKVDAKGDISDLVDDGMNGWDNDDGAVDDAILMNPFILVESDRFTPIEDYIENHLE